MRHVSLISYAHFNHVHLLSFSVNLRVSCSAFSFVDLILLRLRLLDVCMSKVGFTVMSSLLSLQPIYFLAA